MAKKKEKEKAKPVSAVEPARPLPALADWERDMERWFDDFRRRWRWPSLFGSERWESLPGLRMETPTVDVYEKDNQVIITAEVPGMTKDDVEVDLTDSTLTIRGTKKKEQKVQEKDYYHCERSYGSFARTISLPAQVNTDAAKATFKSGVLEIRLPKVGDGKKKSVKIGA